MQENNGEGIDMPANTAMIIATTANTQAIIASNQAREAKKIACKDLETHFTGQETQEVKKQYAECIQLLYSEPASNNEILIGKGLVALLFIGIIIGLIHAKRDENGVTSYLVYPLVWGMGLPLVAFMLGLLVKAFIFLVS